MTSLRALWAFGSISSAYIDVATSYACKPVASMVPARVIEVVTSRALHALNHDVCSSVSAKTAYACFSDPRVSAISDSFAGHWLLRKV